MFNWKIWNTHNSCTKGLAEWGEVVMMMNGSPRTGAPVRGVLAQEKGSTTNGSALDSEFLFSVATHGHFPSINSKSSESFYV